MALVVLCGHPCSGKTRIAEAIEAELATRMAPAPVQEGPVLPRPRTAQRVVRVDEPGLGLGSRDACYQGEPEITYLASFVTYLAPTDAHEALPIHPSSLTPHGTLPGDCSGALAILGIAGVLGNCKGGDSAADSWAICKLSLSLGPLESWPTCPSRLRIPSMVAVR